MAGKASAWTVSACQLRFLSPSTSQQLCQAFTRRMEGHEADEVAGYASRQVSKTGDKDAKNWKPRCLAVSLTKQAVPDVGPSATHGQRGDQCGSRQNVQRHHSAGTGEAWNQRHDCVGVGWRSHPTSSLYQCWRAFRLYFYLCRKKPDEENQAHRQRGTSWSPTCSKQWPRHGNPGPRPSDPHTWKAVHLLSGVTMSSWSLLDKRQNESHTFRQVFRLSNGKCSA